MEKTVSKLNWYNTETQRQLYEQFAIKCDSIFETINQNKMLIIHRKTFDPSLKSIH